ncbi:MAG TPA: serine hydrolase [Bryobacteraceae bacterium]|nr:serine hydrolase [Bryobacteraceae bacterium]
MVRQFILFVSVAALCLGQETARMDQIVQSYVSAKTFMGSVLVARGNEVLFNKGYGMANLEWDVPNSPSSKYRLGSITKQFTAACILLLEERGKLKLEDPVKKYIPDAPAAWNKITIFHLLTHTSGLSNDDGQGERLATTPEKMIAGLRDMPLDFEPGENWKYSNSGYVVLGYLIEKISGRRYEEFLKQNIFTPLGMKDTGYDSSSEIIAHRAAGYMSSSHGLVNGGFVDMSVPFSAGALYSTTEDLLRWELGLFGGKILSPTSLQKMTTPFRNDYAFGLFVHSAGNRKLIDHAGAIPGFNAHLAYYPEDKLTVVVLGNFNSRAPTELASKLGAIAHGEPLQLTSERQEVTVAAARLAGYVGTYEFAPGINLTIRLEGTQLTGQVTGQGKFEMHAQSETVFFLKVVDAQVEFKQDEGGEYAILHEGGRDQRAVKKANSVAERREIMVPRSILEHYAGTYELQPGFEIVVTLEGEQLMTQATGQPKFPVFAESETKFFLKVVDAEIEFIDGYAILHQGGRDMTAKRK